MYMSGVLPLLLAMFLAPPQAQQSEVQKLFGAAADAQQRGDFPAAIRDYQHVLQLNPKLVDARVNLGAALAHTGRLDDAIAQYRLALQAIPENPEVRTDLGLALYKKNDLANAAREFEEARKGQPRNVQLAILLGDSEVKLGRASEAVAFMTPLEPENAGNADFEYVLGSALIASGKRRDGATRLQHVAETTGAADTNFLAGSTWLDLNETELARKDLEVAASADPRLPRIQTLLGMARDHAGDTAQAETAFRAALQQKPDDFDANLYLGAILLKNRDLPGAKPLLDRALQLNGSSTMARFQDARWKNLSGEYAAAVTELEAVTKAQPEWLDPHVELASVYYKLHRPDDGARERAIVAKLTEEQQKKGPGK